ncbi:U1 small nuclear ribonucleoprotein C [Gnomoniopsis smithogilvyi]|uniref:U1 small nuclear ribonucleoprotein C n=1 Tax=Gnomoniopsis smithogilvyi TaxID=1191159 RepID=A0A9W8Z1S3_9PEZI|nr:U1 small nuclear ribonucleoprotein C [Gnomoniopsis smithogilvyi]
MPKFFCDYCDVYLTHDSMSVRKAHNTGRNHIRNVVDYYQQIGHEKAQSVIDSITSSYAAEGQAHNNPMLPQNQPGGGAGGFGAFPPPPMGGMPPFPFPGGMPPPGFPAPPPGGLGVPPPGAAFPGGMPVPPPIRPGSGFSMPPFPPPITPTSAGGASVPPPGSGGFPIPPPGAPGGLPFPPPQGGVPPNFPFPPPGGFPGMPPFNPNGGPPPGQGR